MKKNNLILYSLVIIFLSIIIFYYYEIIKIEFLILSFVLMGVYLISYAILSKYKDNYIELDENVNLENHELEIGKVTILDTKLKKGKVTILDNKIVSEKERIMNEASECHFCNKILNISIDKYFCKYCQNVHCIKDRLPENHKCKGNPKSPYNYVGRMKYGSGKTTYLGPK